MEAVITGKLVSKEDVEVIETKSGKEFKKLKFVVETEGEYPQTFQLEGVKNAIDFLEKMKEGDSLIAECNLRGRHWNNGERGKKNKDFYFTTLEAWKVSPADATTATAAAGGNTPAMATTVDEEDDLPF